MASLESLIQPLLTSISVASTLCAEIKTNRHCGTVHIQLDLLETSLLDGPPIISSQSAGLESSLITESAQKEFDTYATQLALICGRLESIAHPSSHISSHHHEKQEEHENKHHSHHKNEHEHRSHSSHSTSSPDEKEKEHHHHKPHSNTKPLVISALKPIHYHHHGKEIEDPHFHEIREAWESVRKRISATLAGLKTSVEEVIVEKMEKVEIKEEGGSVEEVVKEVEMIEVKEGKVEVKKEEGKAEAKHVEAKETELIVVEIEDSHHASHDGNISLLDSGSESESEDEEKKILLELS